MAITHVGSAQATEGPANTNDMTLTQPTHSANDFGIILAKADEAGTIPALSVGTTGWSQLLQTNEQEGRDRVSAVFYKLYTSGSETNPAVSTDFGENRSCILHVLRGVDTVDHWASASPFYQLSEGQNDLNPNQVDITTDADNAAILLFHNFSHAEHTAGGPPSGYTFGQFVDPSGNSHAGAASAYLLDAGTAGAKTPGVWTHSGSVSQTDWTTISIAIKAAVAGGANPMPVILPYYQNILAGNQDV